MYSGQRDFSQPCRYHGVWLLSILSCNYSKINRKRQRGLTFLLKKRFSFFFFFLTFYFIFFCAVFFFFFCLFCLFVCLWGLFLLLLLLVWFDFRFQNVRSLEDPTHKHANHKDTESWGVGGIGLVPWTIYNVVNITGARLHLRCFCLYLEKTHGDSREENLGKTYIHM